jgi:phosphotransferase system enzyme I (PtsI)
MKAMVKVLFKGKPVSQGFAIGKAFILRRSDIFREVDDNCRAIEVEKELEKLWRALSKLREKMFKLRDSATHNQLRDIINAQVTILEAIAGEVEKEIREGLCAESSLRRITLKYYNQISSSGSELIGMRADDVLDVGTQLMSELRGKGSLYTASERNFILVTEDILPSDLISLKPLNALGLITRHGGVNSHVSIIARTLNIPYIIVPDIELSMLNNSFIALDGYRGFILSLSESDIEGLAPTVNKLEKLKESIMRNRLGEAITVDGKKIGVLGNVGDLEDVRLVKEYGGEGIGLFRLEFLYMNRAKRPSEEELFKIFVKALQIMEKGEVVIRALDAGGDKPISYITNPREGNPFLGVRGIRLLLKDYPDILLEEVRAALRASMYGKVGFMIPMVSTIKEVEEVKKIVNEVEEEIGKGAKLNFEFGIMVEVPSIAIVSDRIGKYLDFVSIGTNDLTQYVMAADRDNERVQYLYDELNPAVIRIIDVIARNSKKENVRVDVCGEMASNEIALPILLSLGIDNVSVNPTSIPKVKYLIRKINAGEISTIIKELIIKFEREEEIKEASLSYISRVVPEIYELNRIYERS